MSDSQPPVWGSAPWDGRDLGPTLPDEALTEGTLLAGPAFGGDDAYGDDVYADDADVPEQARRADEAVLSERATDSGGYPGPPRPAEAVIAALRAAPGPGELDGEAAARATFSLLTLPGARPPAALSGPLPVRRADGGSRRPPGSHRRPSRAQWEGRRRITAALVGAGAAVAGVIALTCALNGTGTKPPEAAPTVPVTSSAAAPSASPAVKQQAVEGHGAPTQVSTPVTSPTPSAAQQAALCREYLDWWSGNWQTWKSAAGQLSPLAGGRRKIDGYCFDLLGQRAGSSGSGGQQAYQPGAAGSHGSFGNGPGGSGNGQGGPGGQDAH
jgi:hypothetical protein